jgi:biopolymer transport protein ExbB/TolQ
VTGHWHDPFVLRYFAGHWVEYLETAMFFVGMASLIIKALDVGRQSAALHRTLLPTRETEAQSPADSRRLLDHLSQLPDAQQDDYLPRRLREALQSVLFAGTADKLGDELKYLSESDGARSHASYGQLRIIIWAIPILGFLGTVIGITMAIASLNPQALEDSLPTVTGGLGVAFDTTALALGLSMVLMFLQYFVDRMEGRLLAAVDAHAAEELAGRFEQLGAGDDPQLAAMRRLAETMLRATDKLVQRQAELWQQSIDAAGTRWSEMATSAGRQLESSLSGALAQAMATHAEKLAASAEATAEQNRQAEILLRVVEATGNIAKLEEQLNRNLGALAGAQHFEETLLNLSGTINLLNARLGHVSVPQVGLTNTGAIGKAA